MQNARANSACDIPALVRIRFMSTSSGSTIRRVGSLAWPSTRARIFFGALLQRQAEPGSSIGSGGQLAYAHDHRPPFAAFFDLCREFSESDRARIGPLLSNPWP
jgi:hypothetical protein